MHTIPDKLNALRQSIEASLIRHNVEFRQEFEKKLSLAVEACEESAYNRAVTFVVPQITATTQRLDEQLPKLFSRMDEVVTMCNNSSTAVRVETQDKLQALQVEVAGLRVEIPPLRNHIQDNAEAYHRLATFPAEIRESMRASCAEMTDWRREMTLKIDSEINRASAAELMLRRHIDDHAEKAATETKAVEHRAREQSAAAIGHSSSVHERLLCHIDDHTRKATEEIHRQTREVSASIAPAIKEAIDEVHKKVADGHERAESRVAKSEKMLREEFKTIMADATAAFDNSTELKAAEILTTMSDNMELTKKDIASVREVGREALQETINDFFGRVDELSASLDIRFAEVQEKAIEGEERIVNQTEVSVQKIHSRTETIEESLQVLALDGQDIKADMRKQEDRLKEESQKELQCVADRLEKQAQDVGHRCETFTSQTVNSLERTLRGEIELGFKDSTERVEKLASETNVSFAEEKESRRLALAELEVRRSKELHERVVDMQASIASSVAETAARTEGTNRRVEALGDKISKSGVEFEAYTEHHENVVSKLKAQLQVHRDELDAANANLNKALEQEASRAEDDLKKETANLWEEIVQVRGAFTSEINQLASTLSTLATKSEAADSLTVAKSALAANSELTGRFNVFETAVERQKSWIEDHSQDLAARCHEAQAHASEAKFRTQRETTTLASEVTMLRAAATSLTHGVIKTLQILGVLTEDFDVLPPKASGGTATMLPRRWGVDVSDLLEWEKKGQGLASRLQNHWQPFEAAGLPNLLTLVERKANEADLRTLRAAVSMAARPISPDKNNLTGSWSKFEGKPWTPSTVADEPSRGDSALSRASAASPFDYSFEKSELAPSPPLVPQSPGGPRRPGHTSMSSSA